MNMIDRYKKKGGFIQLLALIETTTKEKAEKFLKLIAEESPAWEAEIRKKVLTIERMSSWNQTYLMEILPRLSANVIAAALHSLPPTKQQVFLGAIPFTERRKTEELIRDTKPTPGETASCQMKILNEVRAMVDAGQLKFDKVDPEMLIPENIEDLLNSGVTSSPSVNATAMGAAESGVSLAHPPAGTPANVQEEMLQLRRRMMSITQENQLLKTQLQQMKEKIDSIRKAAA